MYVEDGGVGILCGVGREGAGGVGGDSEREKQNDQLLPLCLTELEVTQ